MPDGLQPLDPVAIARALVPRVAARADEIEAARRLPADLAQDFAAAGLFRMATPAAYGGGECAPAAILGAIETISQADASAGWCLMIGATTALTAAYLPPAQAREVFADPLTITGGVFAPLGRAVVDGGDFVASGRWPWGSGSANCAWLLGGCVIVENGVPRLREDGATETRMVFARRADVMLEDTWFASGMRGTGSGDLVMEGVRAPADRSVSLSHDRPQVGGALYAFPPFGLLAMGIAAVASGNARAAIDELMALAEGKKTLGAKRTLAHRSATQDSLARAEAALRASRALLFAETEAAWTEAQTGDALSLERRAGLRLAATHMTRTGADVCRAMYDLGGGSAVYATSPLQRRFRDAHVATQHIMVAPATFEVCGRVLLGLEADVSVL